MFHVTSPLGKFKKMTFYSKKSSIFAGIVDLEICSQDFDHWSVLTSH